METTQLTPRLLKPFSSSLQNVIEGCRNNSWTNLRKTSRNHQENTKKTFKTKLQSVILFKGLQEDDVVMILWLKGWWNGVLGLFWVVGIKRGEKSWVKFTMLVIQMRKKCRILGRITLKESLYTCPLKGQVLWWKKQDGRVASAEICE